MPDHSTLSKNRHGRFRNSALFRPLFEAVVSPPWTKPPGVRPPRSSRSSSHPLTQRLSGLVFFAYADNDLIDLKTAMIVDVEASRAVR